MAKMMMMAAQVRTIEALAATMRGRQKAAKATKRAAAAAKAALMVATIVLGEGGPGGMERARIDIETLAVAPTAEMKLMVEASTVAAFK